VVQIWKDRDIFGYENSWQEYANLITKEGYQVNHDLYINFNKKVSLFDALNRLSCQVHGT